MQPELVVTRYNAMAGDLERYAESPRADGSRSETPRTAARSSRGHSHTLDGLRADLASLWP